MHLFVELKGFSRRAAIFRYKAFCEPFRISLKKNSTVHKWGSELSGLPSKVLGWHKRVAGEFGVANGVPSRTFQSVYIFLSTLSCGRLLGVRACPSLRDDPEKLLFIL